MSTKTKDETEAPTKLARLKVRAIAEGTYGHGPFGPVMRNVGNVFTITPREIPLINRTTGKAELDANGKLKTTWLSVEQQFSSGWMEVVNENEPERSTTAQQEIDRQVKELNSRGASGEDAG